MNEDPRLLEWLELTESALQARDGPRGQLLERTVQERGEIMRSLEQRPPAEPPGPDLARRLRDAERRLQEMARALRRELEARASEVRALRNAARGYRPTAGDFPAFISRSI